MLLNHSAHAREGYSSHFVVLSFCIVVLHSKTHYSKTFIFDFRPCLAEKSEYAVAPTVTHNILGPASSRELVRENMLSFLELIRMERKNGDKWRAGICCSTRVKVARRPLPAPVASHFLGGSLLAFTKQA